MSQPSVKSFFKDVNSNNSAGTGEHSHQPEVVASPPSRRRLHDDDPDPGVPGDEVPEPPVKVSKPVHHWANRTEIMSIKDICDNVDSWATLDTQAKDNHHKSTKYGHKASIPADFDKSWPYIEQIRVSDILKHSPQHFEAGAFYEDLVEENMEDGHEKTVKTGCDRVVGLLCTVCRNNLSTSEVGSMFNKNGLVFVNVPRAAPFGSIREILKCHEFGRKVKGEQWKMGPANLRGKFMDGSLDVKTLGSTTHMRFQLDLRSQRLVKENKSRPDELLYKKVCSNMGTSKDAVTVLFGNVLKLIKSRTSVFTNLRPELEFQRQFGASEPIKFLVDTLKLHYTSMGSIVQIIDSLDLARHHGVLQELMAQRPDGEDPSYGALLDCGSGQAHFREFVGFDIKVEDQEGNMVCRVLGFPATDRKTGFHLMKKFEELVKKFNRFDIK